MRGLWVSMILSFAGCVQPPSGAVASGRITRVRGDLGTLRTALVQFEIDHRRPPTQEEGLDALMKRPPGIAVEDWFQRLAGAGCAGALVGQLIVLAVMLQRCFAGPDLAHDVDVFLGLGDRLAVRVAVPAFCNLRT